VPCVKSVGADNVMLGGRELDHPSDARRRNASCVAISGLAALAATAAAQRRPIVIICVVAGCSFELSQKDVHSGCVNYLWPTPTRFARSLHVRSYRGAPEPFVEPSAHRSTRLTSAFRPVARVYRPVLNGLFSRFCNTGESIEKRCRSAGRNIRRGGPSAMTLIPTRTYDGRRADCRPAAV
jgi:hypothetical protein